MDSYVNDTTWKLIQNYLPVNNRLSENHAPEEKFVKMDDMNIHVDHYTTKLKPKARIILFHGIGGNGRLLSFIAVPLHKKGFEIICPDLPLYGLTQYSKTISYEHWVDIGEKIVKYFMDDDVPTFLFGLSAGGLLAYQVLTRCSKVSGLIVTCLLDQRDRFITKATAINPIMGVVGVKVITALHKPLGFFRLPIKMIANMNKISNNKNVTRLLIKDKRSSGAKVTIKFIHSMLNPKIEIEPEEFTICPVLMVHPENDNWTDVGLSERFFSKIPGKKRLVMLKGAGHFPFEEIGLTQLENSCIEFVNQILDTYRN